MIFHHLSFFVREEERERRPSYKKAISTAVARAYEIILLRRGVFFSVLSGCCLGLHFVLVGSITSMSPYQIMFYRCIPFLLSVSFVSWDKSEFYHANDMLLYTTYGVLNVVAILLSYVALHFAHVGNVSAISTNMPLPAAFLGWFLLGEKITFFDTLLFTANMIGLVCVAKPPFIFREEDLVQNRYEFIGALIAIGALISIVLSIIASRKLAYRNNSDPALQSFFPGMVGLLLTGTILSIFQMWVLPASVEEGLMCLLVAILSLLGNVFVVLGLKYERVVVCTVLVTVSVPVSFLAAIVVLHQVPDVVSVIGAVLTIGSTLGCLFRPD